MVIVQICLWFLCANWFIIDHFSCPMPKCQNNVLRPKFRTERTEKPERILLHYYFSINTGQVVAVFSALFVSVWLVYVIRSFHLNAFCWGQLLSCEAASLVQTWALLPKARRGGSALPSLALWLQANVSSSPNVFAIPCPHNSQGCVRILWGRALGALNRLCCTLHSRHPCQSGLLCGTASSTSSSLVPHSPQAFSGAHCRAPVVSELQYGPCLAAWEPNHHFLEIRLLKYLKRHCSKKFILNVWPSFLVAQA